MSSVSSIGAAPPPQHAQHAKSEAAHKPPAKTEQHETKPAAAAAKPSPHKVDVKA
jgi:hypothetical protein